MTHMHVDAGPLTLSEVLRETNERLQQLGKPLIDFSGERGDHGEYCFDISPLQADMLHTVSTEKGATTDYASKI
jgi:hypothetical protein